MTDRENDSPGTFELLDGMQEPVLIADRSGVIRYANNPAGELLGYPEEDLIGRVVDEFGIDQSPTRNSADIRPARVITSQNGNYRLYLLRSGNGSRRPARSGPDPLDISQFDLLEFLAEGVLLIDQNADVLYMNPAAREIVGVPAYEPYEFNLTHILDDPLFPAEPGDPDTEHDSRTTPPDPDVREAVIRRSDGRTSQVLVRQMPRAGSAAETGQTVVTLQDISDQKHAELQVSLQQQVLELIASGGPLADAGALVLDYLEQAIPGTSGQIYQLDRETSSLDLLTSSRTAPAIPDSTDDPDDKLIVSGCHTALETRRPVVHADVRSFESPSPEARALADAGVRGVWFYPVLSSASTSVGVIVLYRDHPGELDHEFDGLIEPAAALIGIALDRVQMERDLQHQSFNDDLTGLPNRVLLMDRLDGAIQRAARSDHQVALLLLNIDRFQLVNNSLGRQAGDDLLRETARRLRDSLRSDDLVARVAGDQFGILLDFIGSEADAINVVMRIQRAFATPVTVTGVEIYTSASIGIALSTERDTDAEGLVRFADIALQRAKDGGRGQFAVFSPARDLTEVPTLEIQSRLHRALAADALDLHYQPVLSLTKNEVTGYEALVRWHDQQFGDVAPEEFLPLAQQAGIMSEITAWVLDRAVSQMRQWQASGDVDQFVSVNISPSELYDSLLVEQVDAVLRRYGIAPHLLMLEMTEQAVVDSAGQPNRTLHKLRDLGVRLALDDFGTGYSSLSYLEQLPVDAIKIDRTFIQAARGGASRAPVATAMADLARKLGMLSIAEGIETPEDERVARNVGCDYCQGYFYGRPQPESRIRQHDPRMRHAE